MKAKLAKITEFVFPRRRAKQSFAQSIKSELPVLILFTLGTLILNGFHAFDSCQNPFLNLGLRAREFKNDKCLLVCIDDNAYYSKKLFGGHSPLDASKLSELLDSISDCNTPLMVVDIGTASQPFLPLRQKNFHNKKIVWAQGGSESKGGDDSTQLQFMPPQTPLSADGALGDRDFGRISGVSIFEPDADGSIRRLKRTTGLEVHSGIDGHSVEPFETLAFKAYREYTGTQPQNEREKPFLDSLLGRDENEMLLNFSSIPEKLHGYSASNALWMARSPHNTWKDAVGDRIVIVGCTYGEDRDKYLTPAGYIDGVKLHLMAVETLCSGKPTRKVDQIYLFITNLMFGISFVALTHFLTKRKPVYTIILAFALAMVLSIFFFSNFNMAVSFVPLAVGLLAHLMHECWQEQEKMLAELGALKAKEA